MVLPGGCSCPNNTDNKSSFRINCLLISQDFHVVFLWGFLTVTTAAFGEKRTLMLRLFTAINMFCGQCLGDHCAWLFNWVLRVTPMAQCADLLSVHRFTVSAQIYWVFLRKCYQNCWRKSPWHSGETCGSNTTGLHVIEHVRSQNISPSITKIAGLDGPGLWLGLPGHRASYYLISPYGATWKLRLTHRQTILKRQQHKPDMFEGTRQFMLRRVRLWIEADELTVAYLL